MSQLRTQNTECNNYKTEKQSVTTKEAKYSMSYLEDLVRLFFLILKLTYLMH